MSNPYIPFSFSLVILLMQIIISILRNDWFPLINLFLIFGVGMLLIIIWLSVEVLIEKRKEKEKT